LIGERGNNERTLQVTYEQYDWRVELRPRGACFGIKELSKHHFRHFNAASLVDAAEGNLEWSIVGSRKHEGIDTWEEEVEQK
jgi:hypothetical protein